MKDRFEGEDGRARLLEALLPCEAVRSDRELAAALAGAAELREHAMGDLLIGQGAYDTDVAFLLSGEVEILVRDRVVARRRTGDHVGEMAAIDPRAARSATVRAARHTVAAWVEERKLVAIADKHPRLWRAFAMTLADRLRERGKLQRRRRMDAAVLLPGGTEPQEAVADLEAALRHANASPVCWSRHTRPSTLPLDELRSEAQQADFAIVDLRTAPTPDAFVELGLLLGVLGRKRVFVLRNPDTPIPDYLGGLILLQPDAGPIAGRIAARVQALGPR